jgi:cephalosporin hydroxylase
MAYDDNFMEHLIADAFHVMYYHSNVWNGGNTKWMGVGVFNHPLDMWVKQEIIYETKPTLIIETGTAMGGSARFYATLLDQMGEGRIVSIDIQDKNSGMGLPQFKHKRVQFVKASSVDPATIKGTGKDGRLTKEDVAAAASSKPVTTSAPAAPAAARAA